MKLLFSSKGIKIPVLLEEKQMLISGERLNSFDVEKVVNTIFEKDIHEKRKKSLANAVLGNGMDPPLLNGF